jgi:hypothetical protein
MKATVLAGLYFWSVFQPDRGIDFNGFFWTRENGNLLVDPLPLDDHSANLIDSEGGARWVLVTNAEHLRDATRLRQRYGAGLIAPTAERERLGQAAGTVDHWVAKTSDLPLELQADVALYLIHGGKSAVELALFIKPLAAMLFGDEVRSHASGRLNLLPDALLADKARVIESIRALREIPFTAALLGDGDSLFHSGKQQFDRLLEELGAP